MLKQRLKGAAMLLVIWIVLSGRFEAKYLISGIAGCIVISFFCAPALIVRGETGRKDFNLLNVRLTAFFGYWLWLLGEIIRSSLSISAAILSPKMNINPQIVEIDYAFDNPAAVTVFVNSIILTPGTVTVDVIDERIFRVHALTDRAALGLMDGEMQRRISRVFERQETPQEARDKKCREGR